MGRFTSAEERMVTVDRAPPGRDEAMPVTAPARVQGTEITPSFAEGLERDVFAPGCSWGAERTFWRRPGVSTAAVGYAGGISGAG
jgi:peptide-methionine (S)-S-oxide reductase